MTLHFQAEAVEIEETDFNVLCVGFYTEESYLMFQQNLEESEVGVDSYYIERDDQSCGGYGGVSGVRLSRDSISVELDETGRENLECDAVTVNFETDDETFALLSEKLAFIFGEKFSVR